MKIICKVKECKYCSESNFCTKVFVIINPAGECGRIYDNNGRVKPNWNEQKEDYRRRAPNVREIIPEGESVKRDPAEGEEKNDTK